MNPTFPTVRFPPIQPIAILTYSLDTPRTLITDPRLLLAPRTNDRDRPIALPAFTHVYCDYLSTLPVIQNWRRLETRQASRPAEGSWAALRQLKWLHVDGV